MCDESRDGKYDKNDSRPACKYGKECYQTNPDHLNKYKHPAKRQANNGNAAKKFKINDYFKAKPKGDKPSTTAQHTEDTNSTKKQSDKKPCEPRTHSDETVQNRATCDDTPSKKTTEKEHSKAEPTVISSSEDSETSTHVSDKSATQKPQDLPLGTSEMKEFIKEKFLVEMPHDFYLFWDFCKTFKEENPTEALRSLGLKLVGPYDVLAGKFSNVNSLPEDQYLLHWRYYHDPPEFQTVLKGDDSTGFHIGYFRDSPDELPCLLASNHQRKDGVFQIVGDNIFAALNTYLDEIKSSSDPFKKMVLNKYQTAVKTKAEELGLNLSPKSDKIKNRERKIVARTFNKIGLVVPYNKKSQLGYRPLAAGNKELKILLDKIEKASPDQRGKHLSELQPVLTFASIAADEFDFGTGIELGWDILCHGVDCLNSTIGRFLATSYRLLNREVFATIAEAHMKNRKKSCNLSVI